MYRRLSYHRHQDGFSLIELAAIIGVVASLAVGYMQWIQPPVRTNAEKIIETRQKMQEIQNRLISFVLVHKRLPCPADPSMRIDGTRHATSAIVGTFQFATEALVYDAVKGVDCPSSIGAVPTTSLNLSESYMLDAWGNRFTYHVSPNLCGDDADVVGLAAGQDALVGCSARDYSYGININAVPNNIEGNLLVKDASAGNDLITDAAFVLMSHGANGLGAYSDSGARAVDSASDDEEENSNTYTDDTDVTYIKRQLANDFDDIVMFLNKTQINSLSRSYSVRLVDKDECETNTIALQNTNITIATDMDTAVNDYRIDLDGTGTVFYNEGSSVLIGLMWALQSVCGHIKYYGPLPDGLGTWSGLRCPGGAPPPVNGVCTCGTGAWDGAC